MTRWVAALVLVGALLLVGFALPYTIFPQSRPAPSDHSDAVLLFSGGHGERLGLALDVMPRTDARVLYISNGADPQWPEANALCDERQGSYTVRCFQPVPNTTRGEARALARLAEERGWRSVTVLTSTYHVTRARLLAERCFDGEVEAVGANPHEPGFLRSITLSLRELAALARHTILERDC